MAEDLTNHGDLYAFRFFGRGLVNEETESMQISNANFDIGITAGTTISIGAVDNIELSAGADLIGTATDQVSLTAGTTMTLSSTDEFNIQAGSDLTVNSVGTADIIAGTTMLIQAPDELTFSTNNLVFDLASLSFTPSGDFTVDAGGAIILDAGTTFSIISAGDKVETIGGTHDVNASIIDYTSTNETNITSGTTMTLTSSDKIVLEGASLDFESTGAATFTVAEVNINSSGQVLIDSGTTTSITSATSINIDAGTNLEMTSVEEMDIIAGTTMLIKAPDQLTLDTGNLTFASADITFSPSGDFIVNAGGAVDLTAGTTAIITATDDITLDSGDTVTIDGDTQVAISSTNEVSLTSGTTMSLEATGILDLIGSDIKIQATTGFVDIDSATTFNMNSGTTLDIVSGTDMTLNSNGTFDIIADGNATLGATGTLDVQTTGNITIDSSGGTIGIGTDADDNDINIGTAGTRNVNVGVAGSTLNLVGTTVNIGTTGGTVNLNDDLTVWGNLTVQGNTTTLNTETVTVDDNNIELGSIDTPTDTSANGGGITLKGATDKSITWANDSNDAWSSHANFNVPTGSSYLLNNLLGLSETQMAIDISTADVTSNDISAIFLNGPGSISAPAEGDWRMVVNSNNDRLIFQKYTGGSWKTRQQIN